MEKFKIGVLLDSFRTKTDEALKLANEVGAEGIQVYATKGEMSPENLTGQKIKDFINKCSYAF